MDEPQTCGNDSATNSTKLHMEYDRTTGILEKRKQKIAETMRKHSEVQHGLPWMLSGRSWPLYIPVPILSSGSEICFNSRSSNLQKKIE
jgi:hypothetical protein